MGVYVREICDDLGVWSVVDQRGAGRFGKQVSRGNWILED